MAANRNKPKKKSCDIQKLLPRMLQAGLLFAIFFGFCGFSPANAQAVESPKLEEYNLIESNPDSSMRPTDQVIIQYQDTLKGNKLFDPASPRQLQQLSDAAGVSLTYWREMSGDAYVYRLPSKMAMAAVQVIIERLAELPEVALAEPDIILQHTRDPDDTYYDLQWHYGSPPGGGYGINAPPAWDVTTGSSSIVVAVIDTGITNHSEFVGRTVPGYDFISDILVANDGNGRDSDPSDPGDWITAAENANGDFEDCGVSDSSWHGTHTAGTIGAASDNGVGVAGINWNSKILPVRVLGKCGGYTSDITDGMRWAAGLPVTGVPANANPAKVINLSLGGSGSCGSAYQNAIDAITAAGTTVVVSAGNNNFDASGFRPANCNGVITVAATRRDGSKASYSNFGSTVEISAPGGDWNPSYFIASTWNTGTTVPVAETYAYMAGTSMAAPHVSGVASLLYSINPSLTPDQVLQILQDSVTHFPAGSTCTTSTCGSGIVNAGEAVMGTPTAVDFVSFTATGTATSILLNWQTATEIDNLGFNLYRAETLDGQRTQINPEMIASLAPGSATGYTYEYIDSGVGEGISYNYWLEDEDIYGRKNLHGPAQAQLLADLPDSSLMIFLPAIFGQR